MIDARTEFNRIFGDVVMSDNDAAWYIFKAGWNAARASGDYPIEAKPRKYGVPYSHGPRKYQQCSEAED